MEPRKKPLLLYDGQCAFCLQWIDRWKSITGTSIDYAPSSTFRSDHPAIPEGEFKKSVVLVMPDGTFLTGAIAVFTALGDSAGGRVARFFYRHLPGFGASSEAVYRWVAGHRDEAHLLSRMLWGNSVTPPGFALSGWLFLRGMAVVYFVAFASLSTQILGLVGSDGISPASMFLGAVYSGIGGAGPLYYPTIAWLNSGNAMLSGMCVAGMVISVLLFIGILPRVSAFLAWALWFSLFTVGQVFLNFQWDALLLEAGFLTIFFAPFRFLDLKPGAFRSSPAVRWLLWLLVFRLMFMSGWVKLASGDPNWWNLSALTFHYQTQPLPNPLSWYAHQLPAWFQQLSVFLMFVIELGAPFLIFTPRRLRHAGALCLIVLQVLVFLTGNYAFFNILSVVLCLALLDDGILSRFIPGLHGRGTATSVHAGRSGTGRTGLAFFVIMAFLNCVQISGLIVPRELFPSPVATFAAWGSRFHMVGGYGLFRVMTTRRPEVVLEGSDDGSTWKEYGLRYKPGDPLRALPWAAPGQPRLDWQMWFAALGEARNNGWLMNVAIRLLEGSPEVESLFAVNPFAGHPPEQVRAMLYVYRFTTPAERDSTGAVWVRSLNGLYFSPISLQTDGVR
jgi:predicted DCC family thiol-disulfide oxidoreductase YuxK